MQENVDFLEIIPRNRDFKKNKDPYSESYRFSSPKSAQRYLDKLTLMDKIVAYLGEPPYKYRYFGACNLVKKSQEEIDKSRKFAFWLANGSKYEKSNPSMQMIFFRGKVYVTQRGYTSPSPN